MIVVRSVFAGALIFMAQIVVGGQSPIKSALDVEMAAQAEGKAAQVKINRLDDEAQDLIGEYRRLIEQLEGLQSDNTELFRTLEGQQEKLASLEKELAEVEETRREISPLMQRMLEVLGQFVTLDQPFLPQERQTRLQQLRESMEQGDVDQPEQFRRLLTAYQVEMDYGRTIEAYRGEIDLGNGPRMVEFLRLGRVALYYRALDDSMAGVWDPDRASWLTLGDLERQDIDRAIRIARKHLPPNLMPLSVPAARATP